MVAGTGLEPVNKGYEPFELPVTLSGDVVQSNRPEDCTGFYLSKITKLFRTKHYL